MGSPRRILIRLPNWLGDALLARPLLHALRGSFPDAELTGVAPAPLLELQAADRVLDVERAWPIGPGERVALLDAIRAHPPELALVLPPSFSSAWFAWRTGARERVAYAHEARGFLLTRALPRPARGDRHLSEEYLELGRAVGASPHPVPRLVPPEPAREAASAWLAELGLADRPFAILGPGALYGPAKRWPPERFGELGRALAGQGMSLLVCGTAAEAEVCGRVAAAAGPAASSLAGRTRLLDLAGLCARARLAVCNDSGLAHLCAALGIPTVCVFGSTSSAWTAPLGARIAQRPPVCSPCFQATCRIGYVCLTAVSVGMVRRACEAALAERAA